MSAMLAREDDLAQALPRLGAARAALGEVWRGLVEVLCCPEGRGWHRAPLCRVCSLEKKTIAAGLERRDGGLNGIIRGWEAKGDLN